MNSPDDIDNQDEPPKKKGCMGLSWGCWVGIGCLGILLVCGGGGAAFFYIGYKVGLVPVLEEGVKLAQDNAQAQRELGLPIEYTMVGMQPTPNFNGLVDYTYKITGSKHSGTMHIVARLVGTQVKVMEATVEVNGKIIDVNKTNFEIKDTEKLNQ